MSGLGSERIEFITCMVARGTGKQVIEIAKEEGISKRTMENAKKELGIKAKKMGDTWYWVLQTE